MKKLVVKGSIESDFNFNEKSLKTVNSSNERMTMILSQMRF